MTFIIIVLIIMYLVVIGWTWNNLLDMKKSKKILIILLGLLIVYILTTIVFNISKNGIDYQIEEIEKSIGNVVIILFTGLNSIVLPFVGRNIKRQEDGEIDTNILFKRLIVIGVIFLICIFLECGYMKDIQLGILNIYNSNA